jgi:hypothetical protein
LGWNGEKCQKNLPEAVEIRIAFVAIYWSSKGCKIFWLPHQLCSFEQKLGHYHLEFDCFWHNILQVEQM